MTDIRRGRGRRAIVVLVFAPMILALGVVIYHMASPSDSISVDEANALLSRDSTVVLLDVRTRGEYAGESGHLARAVLIPVEELDGRLADMEQFRNHLIIAYCRSGRRSRNAATLLAGKGFRVLNLTGGILSWTKEHYPVVKEPSP